MYPHKEDTFKIKVAFDINMNLSHLFIDKAVQDGNQQALKWKNI